MLINLRNALMTGKRLPYDAEVEFLRVDAVGPYIVIDGVTYCDAVGTYYAFAISSGGVVTHDLIPVRRGNTGYMYDRITNKFFGNAGTGDFVVGPDVVPVEYIQGNKYSATSGPWIDTGINPSICNDSILECKVAFELLPYTRDQYTGIFGAAVPRFGAYAIDDKLSFGYSSAYDNVVTISRNQVYNLDFESTMGAQSAYLNGEEIWTGTNSSTLSNSYSIGLFCRNAATPAWQNNLRIYNCKFNIDGAPARSFRPVRVGTDATSWEGAMMDVLTRRVYRNAGTGAFTYGNDLKYPIPSE